MRCRFVHVHCDKHDEKSIELGDPYAWIEEVCQKCEFHPNNSLNGSVKSEG